MLHECPHLFSSVACPIFVESEGKERLLRLFLRVKRIFFSIKEADCFHSTKCNTFGWSRDRKMLHLAPDGGKLPSLRVYVPQTVFRKSLWMFPLDSVGGLISGGLHGFLWFMASFLLSFLTLFGLSFCIPIPALLSLLLCVGLWSLKILENEEPATTAGWDSLWARLDPSPSSPFLSDGQLQAWPCLYIPATSGLHLNKPPCCQVAGTQANVDLVFSNTKKEKTIQCRHFLTFINHLQ